MTKVLAAAAGSSLVYDYGKVKVAGFDPGSSSAEHWLVCVPCRTFTAAARGGGSAIARRAAPRPTGVADSGGITANVDVVVKNDGAKIRKGESVTNELLFNLHNVSFEDYFVQFYHEKPDINSPILTL